MKSLMSEFRDKIPLFLRPMILFLFCVSLIGTIQAQLNPNQVALLHWYPAGNAANFAVSDYPSSLAFDGANIWTVIPNHGLVEKYRACDGLLLASTSVA